MTLAERRRQVAKERHELSPMRAYMGAPERKAKGTPHSRPDAKRIKRGPAAGSGAGAQSFAAAPANPVSVSAWATAYPGLLSIGGQVKLPLRGSTCSGMWLYVMDEAGNPAVQQEIKKGTDDPSGATPEAGAWCYDWWSSNSYPTDQCFWWANNALGGKLQEGSWRRLRDWTEAGVWPRLHEMLLAELRRAGLLDVEGAAVAAAPLCGRRPHLVGLVDRGIDGDGPCDPTHRIVTDLHVLQQRRPGSVRFPAGEPLVDRLPRPILLRQITPRRPGPQPPQHTVDTWRWSRHRRPRPSTCGSKGSIRSHAASVNSPRPATGSIIRDLVIRPASGVFHEPA